MELDLFPCSNEKYFSKMSPVKGTRNMFLPRVAVSTISQYDPYSKSDLETPYDVVCNDPDNTYLQRQFRKQFA